jgi:DNA invertase Pin-like site-specific DNA recombinase
LTKGGLWKAKGYTDPLDGDASLKATEQPIDTSTAVGKCFLDMLGVFAEFETNLRRERQLEGIAKAKAAGVYKARPPSIEASRVHELKAQGMRPTDIAKALNIGRASVYRVLGTASGSAS